MAALYNTIGEDYDVTRRADPAILETLCRLLGLKQDCRYLDIACGTGNYTIGLNSVGGHWSGADVSEKMLSEAREKSGAVDWQQADVEDLPWDDKAFHGGVCTLATHHFPDLHSAFLEIGRVMDIGASFVVFTSTPDQMAGYWLNHYFPQMMERSGEQMPSLENTMYALQASGFDVAESVPFFIDSDLQDFFLYSGKDRPAMYLSANVRRGISSFAKLIDKTELDRGLDQLERDIWSGEILEVMERYRNTLGDYLFVHGIKGNG